ncbi:MAG: 7-cyano-7-deazaguanine synthase [Nitrospirae bacterium]|nr:7-cyano-7-deazaguanine synthase [Nitrospirota bacterium]
MSHRAVALFSGGLDSTLAILLILRQGIEVTAITFLTHFGCDITDRSSCSKDPAPIASKYGFDLKLFHLGERFVEIVKNPHYGHGRNMNPCIDCRVLMLREAKTLMELIGADFVISGEVLGQRPMSQRRDTLDLIAKDSGLRGLLLRPLSAKLLPITVPEIKSIVDREKLLSISGRSRKIQAFLAEEFSLKSFPTPSSGCLLTDPIYSRRLRDLLQYTPNPDFDDLNLLKIGRHFRPSGECKIIVGRNKEENLKLRKMKDKNDLIMDVRGTGSPLVLLRGNNIGEFIELGASLCARYSDLKNNPEVSVTLTDGQGEEIIKVTPANQDIIGKYRLS